MYILLITSEGLRILKAAPLEQRLVIRLCRRVFKHAPVGRLVLQQSLAGEGAGGAGGEGTSSNKTQPRLVKLHANVKIMLLSHNILNTRSERSEAICCVSERPPTPVPWCAGGDGGGGCGVVVLVVVTFEGLDKV